MIGVLLARVFILTLILFAPIPQVSTGPSYTGYAAHYGKTVMNKVAHNRNLPIQDCMIATPYYKIGTWLHIHSLKNDKWADCYVMDIPQPRDRAGIITRGIVVEFNWQTATWMCDLEYVDQEPPSACPVEIWEYTRAANNTPNEEKEKSKL